jgi:hypothetical protein
VLVFGLLILFRFENPSVKGVAIAVAVAGIALALRVAVRPSAILSPLSAPKSVVDCGLSGEVLTARILDIATELVDGFVSHGVVNPLQPFVPLPQAEVQGFKLTPDAFGELFREFFGFRRTRITGEMVQSADGTLHLRFRELPNGRRVDVSAATGTPIDNLLAKGAEGLLRNIAPYNLAYAKQRRFDIKTALEIAKTGGDDENLPASIRARCHVLRWHNLRSLGRFEDACAALEEAHRLAKYDLMVLGAVGEHVSDADRVPTQARRFWSYVSRAIHTWTRSAADLDHWTVASAKALGDRVRSCLEEANSLINAARSELYNACSIRNRIRNRLLHPYSTALEIAKLIRTMNKHLFEGRRLLAKAKVADPDGTYLSVIRRLSAHERRLAHWQPSGDDPRLGEANQILEDNLADSLTVLGVLRQMQETVGPVTDQLISLVKHNKEDYAPGGIIEVRDLVRSDLRQAKALLSEPVIKFPFGRTEGERWQHVVDSFRITHDRLEEFAANLIRQRPDVQKRVRSLVRAHRRLEQWINKNRPAAEG